MYKILNSIYKYLIENIYTIHLTTSYFITRLGVSAAVYLAISFLLLQIWKMLGLDKYDFNQFNINSREYLVRKYHGVAQWFRDMVRIESNCLSYENYIAYTRFNKIWLVVYHSYLPFFKKNPLKIFFSIYRVTQQSFWKNIWHKIYLFFYHRLVVNFTTKVIPVLRNLVIILLGPNSFMGSKECFKTQFLNKRHVFYKNNLYFFNQLPDFFSKWVLFCLGQPPQPSKIIRDPQVVWKNRNRSLLLFCLISIFCLVFLRPEVINIFKLIVRFLAYISPNFLSYIIYEFLKLHSLYFSNSLNIFDVFTSIVLVICRFINVIHTHFHNIMVWFLNFLPYINFDYKVMTHITERLAAEAAAEAARLEALEVAEKARIEALWHNQHIFFCIKVGTIFIYTVSASIIPTTVLIWGYLVGDSDSVYTLCTYQNLIDRPYKWCYLFYITVYDWCTYTNLVERPYNWCYIFIKDSSVAVEEVTIIWWKTGLVWADGVYNWCTYTNLIDRPYNWCYVTIIDSFRVVEEITVVWWKTVFVWGDRVYNWCTYSNLVEKPYNWCTYVNLIERPFNWCHKHITLENTVYYLYENCTVNNLINKPWSVYTTVGNFLTLTTLTLIGNTILPITAIFLFIGTGLVWTVTYSPSYDLYYLLLCKYSLQWKYFPYFLTAWPLTKVMLYDLLVKITPSFLSFLPPIIASAMKFMWTPSFVPEYIMIYYYI